MTIEVVLTVEQRSLRIEAESAEVDEGRLDLLDGSSQTLASFAPGSWSYWRRSDGAASRPDSSGPDRE